MTHAYTGYSLRKNSALLKLITLFSAAALSFNSEAQETNTTQDNWYQVELIIFKQNANVNANDKETWPKNLALAYPPNVQHLIDPTMADQEQPLDETPNLDILTSSEAVPELPVPASADTGAGTATRDADIVDEAEQEQPFTLLDKKQFVIEGADYALRRESGVKILFHESWRQPMTELDRAPALIIRGGEEFGEHSELEGSVTFSLSRYLHINTDLWLTSFESNYGQEDKHWPELPQPPKPVTFVFDPDSALDPTSIQGTPFNFGNTPADPMGLGLETNENVIDLSKSTGLLLNDFTRLTEKPYLIREIVTLRQKRRMRSEELHYIDHPRMGILVKITPYAPVSDQEQRNLTTGSL